MKVKLSALDLLFPKVRAEILRILFSESKKQRYVRELTAMSGLALRTVQEELATLTALGVLTSWSNGYHRFYRANRDHPLFPHLLRIVQLSETLPRTRASALHRPRRRRAPKRQSGQKSQPLPVDRPVNWNL